MKSRLCQAKQAGGGGGAAVSSVYRSLCPFMRPRGLYPKWAAWSILLYLGPFQASVV